MQGEGNNKNMINISSMVQEQYAINRTFENKKPLEIMNVIVEMKYWKY